jgi:hypothetical protein
MRQTRTKEPYRVLNWPEYNRALINRGAIELWIEEETLKNWLATDSEPRRAGRPRIYSNAAIQAILLMRTVFRLPLRAVTGMVASLFRMMGVALSIPNYTTLSRRLATLPIALPGLSSPDEVLVLAIDSTGFKIYGEGEWKVRQHGASKRRTWRKCHIVIDVKTLKIVALESTDNLTHDCEVAEELLDSIPNPVQAFAADGAYDTAAIFGKLEERQCQPLIPPRENAVEWPLEIKGEPNPGAAQRNAILECIAKFGSEAWKKASGYHCRSLVENTMYRLKQLFGEKLFSRRQEGDTQHNELLLRAYALNIWTDLGMPKSVPLAAAA